MISDIHINLSERSLEIKKLKKSFIRLIRKIDFQIFIGRKNN